MKRSPKIQTPDCNYKPPSHFPVPIYIYICIITSSKCSKQAQQSTSFIETKSWVLGSLKLNKTEGSHKQLNDMVFTTKGYGFLRTRTWQSKARLQLSKKVVEIWVRACCNKQLFGLPEPANPILSAGDLGQLLPLAAHKDHVAHAELVCALRLVSFA